MYGAMYYEGPIGLTPAAGVPVQLQKWTFSGDASGVTVDTINGLLTATLPLVVRGTEFLVGVTFEVYAEREDSWTLSLYSNGIRVGVGATAIWVTPAGANNSPCFEFLIALNTAGVSPLTGDVLSLWIENAAGTPITIYSGQFCITAIAASGEAGPAGPAGGPSYYAEMNDVSATFTPSGSSTFVIMPYVEGGPVSAGLSPPNPAINQSNGTITIGTTGTYAVDVSMSYASTSQNGYEIGVYVNGLVSALVVFSGASSSGVYKTPSITGLLALSAGDVLDVRATNQGGSEVGLSFSSMIFAINSLGTAGPTGPTGAIGNDPTAWHDGGDAYSGTTTLGPTVAGATLTIHTTSGAITINPGSGALTLQTSSGAININSSSTISISASTTMTVGAGGVITVDAGGQSMTLTGGASLITIATAGYFAINPAGPMLIYSSGALAWYGNSTGSQIYMTIATTTIELAANLYQVTVGGNNVMSATSTTTQIQADDIVFMTATASSVEIIGSTSIQLAAPELNLSGLTYTPGAVLSTGTLAINVGATVYNILVHT